MLRNHWLLGSIFSSKSFKVKIPAVLFCIVMFLETLCLDIVDQGLKKLGNRTLFLSVKLEWGCNLEGFDSWKLSFPGVWEICIWAANSFIWSNLTELIISKNKGGGQVSLQLHISLQNGYYSWRFWDDPVGNELGLINMAGGYAP